MLPISAETLANGIDAEPDASSSLVGTNVQIHRRSSDDRSGACRRSGLGSDANQRFDARDHVVDCGQGASGRDAP